MKMKDFVYAASGIMILILSIFLFIEMRGTSVLSTALASCKANYQILHKTHSNYVSGYNVCTGQLAMLENQLGICNEKTAH